MIANLPPSTLYTLIVKDFEGAWDSLARNPAQDIGRGNFMFARQAMTLLEWVGRLCASDPSALQDFSSELCNIEPRYFTALPGSCGTIRDFAFPACGSQPYDETLLFCMFDLIRNGQAHQYQQIVVRLQDNHDFAFEITGAQCGLFIQDVSKDNRPEGHLTFNRDEKNDLWLKLRPETLFMDLKTAAVRSRLLDRGLAFHYLARPRPSTRSPQGRSANGKYYRFTSYDLEQALEKASFVRGPSRVTEKRAY